MVTALLLAENFRGYGYEISATDLTQHPTRLMQACLLDQQQIGLGQRVE